MKTDLSELEPGDTVWLTSRTQLPALVHVMKAGTKYIHVSQYGSTAMFDKFTGWGDTGRIQTDAMVAAEEYERTLDRSFIDAKVSVPSSWSIGEKEQLFTLLNQMGKIR